MSFLSDLAANNEKTWFEAHRAVYEDTVKAPTAALVTAVTDALRVRDLPLEGAPKRSAFRIHRDVRFSKNKSPYKTNVGTVWYRQGSGKDGAGILYFHLAPTGCFVAAAFYMPEPETLGAIRERIRVNPGKFLVMTKALADHNLALESSVCAGAEAEKLHRAPYRHGRDRPEPRPGAGHRGHGGGRAPAAAVRMGCCGRSPKLKAQQTVGAEAPRRNQGRICTPAQLPASANAIQAQPERLPAAIAEK